MIREEEAKVEKHYIFGLYTKKELLILFFGFPILAPMALMFILLLLLAGQAVLMPRS